ncbi:MAG: hypothetical protein FWG71_03100 [Synergistaceae bacterium]|nr:hypothetical protein [Synergistaceae bacterium]
MKFKGDVIITDPGYFIKSEDDWQLYCNARFGGDSDALGQFGFNQAIIIESEEVAGEVYDDKGRMIGEFCSDSAEICVCLLEDVLKHNPNYDDYNRFKNTATVIRNFDGEIEIHETEDDCEFQIVGKGNINFHTKEA